MTSTHKDATGRQQPISAGIIAALVGYTSSFAVVLTGLSTVGATPKQAASALLALCVTQGLGMIWLTRRYRLPLVLVWSTPGAALLAGVLIELCLAPVTALVDNPAAIIPIALTWLIGVRLAPRWAVPAAFAVAGLALLGTLADALEGRSPNARAVRQPS